MDHPTEKEFRKHVESHRMEIMLDEGVHRHVRFRAPESSNQYFDLITWPGSLCFAGDMGTFVFSRTLDMFEFFRQEKQSGSHSINPQYWSEKLDAADRRTGGYEKFSGELFTKRVNEYLREARASKAVRQAVKDQVLRAVDDGEQAAYEAVSLFKHDEFQFYDFWEINCRDYTYHFIWCCYALSWGIRQYDAQKIQSTASASALSQQDTVASS